MGKMPWRSKSTMDQKIEFINEWKSGKYTFKSLCESYGIARSLGYKLCNRYKLEQEAGLAPRSRAPHTLANRTLTEIEIALCEKRLEYPRFGASKLLTLLESVFDPSELPSLSTANLILKRSGLIQSKKRFRRAEPVYPIFDPAEPNEVWSGDFKGKFLLGMGEYCHPLTIADSSSRIILLAKALLNPTFEATQLGFEEAFLEYGLPLQVHTDNGPPFGCVKSICRLTRLAVWFLELGIEPVYSDPGHPEQNGRHERMHRELKGEATRPPAYNLQGQQRKLNSFVRLYNEIRPHDALKKKTPAQVHVVSPRQYPKKIEGWDYPKEFTQRRVSRNGAIRWGHDQWIGVSTALNEKWIGLEQVGERVWRVYFRQKLLGYLDEKVMRIQDSQGRIKRN
jgi:transposase InsO family protein